MTTLPLKPVVDVFYNLEKTPAVRRGFNLGAIIGSSTTISQTVRGVVFNSVDEMIEYGFLSTSPEVLAAQVYFSATSKPDQLYIGRWVKESSYSHRVYDGPISNGNIVTIGDQSYTVGDGSENTSTLEQIVTAAEAAGAKVATNTDDTLYLLFVSSVLGSEGTVTELQVMQGTGSIVGSVITTLGENQETILEAVQASRDFNTNWYAFGTTDLLSNVEIESLADYIESTNNSNPTAYFAHTNDLEVINGTKGNLFEVLKSKAYNRTIGTATLNNFTHIGIMGYAMGQTSNLANSSYTLALKEIPGVTTDNFTSIQVSAIKSNNGNVYINRGSYYNMYESGTVFSGAWFDEIIQLDKLVNEIQLAVMDLLYSRPKIAQTEGGIATILATISEPCNQAVKTGFIAPGKWTGGNILGLSTNDYLPDGYLALADSLETQSAADRAARKAPNIYLPIKLAGAIQSVVVSINVNR